MTRTMVEPPARDPVHSEPPTEASSSDRRTRMRSGAALVAGALLAIAAVTAFILHKLAAQDPDTWLIDLRVYLLGARHAFSPDLYDQQYPVASLPFTYPPFGAMVMAPLGHLAFPVAATLVTAMSCAALMLVTRRALSAASRLGRRGRGMRWWFIPVGVLAIAFEPVWATFSFGQVNLIVLALCLLDLTGRHRARGVMVGLAAGLKLTPLFFVAYLVFTRQFRAAATVCATFAATVAVGFLFNPHGAAVFWTDAVRDPSRVGSAFFAGNQALTGVLPRWAGEPLPHAVVLVAQALAGLAALVAAAYLHRRGRELESVIAASFGMLAMSPISWSHHWVWAWPAALVLVAALVRQLRGARGGNGDHAAADVDHGDARGIGAAERAPGWAVATGALLMVWLLVFVSRSTWWPPHYKDAELSWSLVQKVLGNTYVVAGALWIAWALLDARAGRRGRNVASPAPRGGE